MTGLLAPGWLVKSLLVKGLLVAGFLLTGLLALLPAPAAAAPWQPPPPGEEAAPVMLRVVGGLAGLNQYTRHEEPFWTRLLPAWTEGRVQAEIVPFDRAGIRGQDMLRLLQAGVLSFGTVLVSQAAAQDPLLGLLDLPGASPDGVTLRHAVQALRPQLAEHLRRRHGLELLAVYAYPAQVLFCKQGFGGLADLAGRRVRVSSAPQGELVEALGGQATMGRFADMVAQMRAGQIDCAITGTMSGNTVGLHEVTRHLHALPINWGVSLFVAHQPSWAGLPPALRQLLQRQLPVLEHAVWDEAERETGLGLACNIGRPACPASLRGRMQLVPASLEDQQRLRQLLADALLPRWTRRCGAACAEAWQAALVHTLGLRTP